MQLGYGFDHKDGLPIMKRKHMGCFIILIGTCLVFAISLTLLYRQVCPDPTSIETIIPASADVEIMLERSLCFGFCPVYTLHIDNNGQVLYNGGKNTHLQGQYKGQMSQEDFQQLVQAFETFNFYALVVEYQNVSNIACGQKALAFSTDAPSVTVGLIVNGRLTQVAHNHGVIYAPKVLTELENLIDDLAHSNQWVRE